MKSVKLKIIKKKSSVASAPHTIDVTTSVDQANFMTISHPQNKNYNENKIRKTIRTKCYNMLTFGKKL